MTEEQRVARGRRAFNDMSEVKASFDAIEAGIVHEIGETPVGQDAKVLNLHKTLHNLHAVRKALQLMIDDGLMAETAIAMAGLNRPSA